MARCRQLPDLLALEDVSVVARRALLEVDVEQ